MIGFFFKLLNFFTLKPLFFLLWNRTTWFILFLIILGLGLKVAFDRVLKYLRFKREKVGGERTALITGGSTGIGLALAKLFVEDEYNVILVSRSEEKLGKAKEFLTSISKHENLEIITWSHDLSDLKSAEDISKKLKDEEIHIDVLVNNAGFGEFSELSSRKTLQSEMINCNCTSLVNLTQLLLPAMIQKKDRRQYILNIASTAGYVSIPFMSVYAATKCFVRSFTKSVAGEMFAHPHVTCTVLSPGFVDTPLLHKFLEMFPEGKKREEHFMNMNAQSADDCAMEGYRGMLSGEYEVVSGIKNYFGVKFMVPLIPLTLMFKQSLKARIKMENDKKEE